jgi:serine/threonine protein kinase
MESRTPQARAGAEVQRNGPGAPLSSSVSTIPERFGPYRRVKSLGEGGMGEMFRARDIERDCLVALKFPRFGPHAHHAEGSLRFRREAVAASAFDHPGLCKVHVAGEVDGQGYIVMDYIEGEPLSKVLNRRIAFMDYPATAQLTRRIALALAEAYPRGVIHRDLNPSNVIIRAGRSGGHRLRPGLVAGPRHAARHVARAGQRRRTRDGAALQHRQPERPPV